MILLFHLFLFLYLPFIIHFFSCLRLFNHFMRFATVLLLWQLTNNIRQILLIYMLFIIAWCPFFWLVSFFLFFFFFFFYTCWYFNLRYMVILFVKVSSEERSSLSSICFLLSLFNALNSGLDRLKLPFQWFSKSSITFKGRSQHIFDQVESMARCVRMHKHICLLQFFSKLSYTISKVIIQHFQLLFHLSVLLQATCVLLQVIYCRFTSNYSQSGLLDSPCCFILTAW